MKYGMRTCGRERAGSAADETNNLIASCGGHSAEFLRRSYCNMIAAAEEDTMVANLEDFKKSLIFKVVTEKREVA